MKFDSNKILLVLIIILIYIFDVKKMSNLINIDGSLLEGGGQIIRIAISLSALTKTPIHITNIRAGRSKPGLMEQHLKGLELIRDITRGKLTGESIGSTDIKFFPDKIYAGKYKSFVKTAGSIGLLLQISIPCILFTNDSTELHMKGGTNAEMAPQVDYITEVFRPVLEKFGASFDFHLVKRGYFPRGGGEVIVRAEPVKELQAIDMTEQGSIMTIYGWSYVAGSLPVTLAQDMSAEAVRILKNVAKVNIETYRENRDVAPIGNCAGIILVAETSTGCILGGSALGKRSETGEETGRRAAEELLQSINVGACVDSHCQDQIIILMALAKGKSRIKTGEITMHTKTAIYVVELLTNAKFTITSSGSASIIECEGIGLTMQ